MALTGTHLRTLDDKSRLAIPKTFREVLLPEPLTQLVIAPETEHALALFSLAQFQLRAEELRDRAGNGADVRNYLRMYFSQAETAEMDKQGRIRIPDRLLEFAALKQEVVLLGVNDRVEVWDRPRWDSFLAEHSQSFDRMAHGI